MTAWHVGFTSMPAGNCHSICPNCYLYLMFSTINN